MENDNQINLPPSFIALFVSPGRQTPSASHAEILARYELCEDLAQMLLPSTSSRVFDRNMARHEVLERCHAGLLGEGAVVSEVEAKWVISRLDELLG
jgi:hypothetical protein